MRFVEVIASERWTVIFGIDTATWEYPRPAREIDL